MANCTLNELQDYKNGELVQIERKWQLYVIDPYALAYHRAFDAFKKTLDDQAKLDKLKMDLMLTGLSLFGGTAFTAVFGDTTTKALAGKIAVDHLNKSNNIRTLKIAGFLDNNPTAQFVIGGLWSEASSAISSKTKALFEPNPKNFPEVDAIAQKPYEIEYSLKKFKLNCSVKLYEALKDIINSNYSDRDKAALLSWAKYSQFCNPPDSNEYPAKLEDKIELSFYMKYILDTDYIHSMLPYDLPGRPQKMRIKAIPGTKAYPERFGPKGQVVYDEVGQVIIDRINKLYKEHFKYKHRFIDSDYFGEKNKPYNPAKSRSRSSRLSKSHFSENQTIACSI